MLNDAIDSIIDTTTKLLKCDRSTCFIVDNVKNELWSKSAKGINKVIRFPIN